MILPEFISGLPKHWATCPIYRKDVVTSDGKKSSGKNPLGKAHHSVLSPAMSLHHLVDEPEKFGAVGVFSGPRSGGVLILDVDYNLGQLQKTYGDSLNGPRVVSPKENAAKYFFLLPQSEWPHISDISLSASGEGWEALWGRQAVVCGDYPGGGVYTPEGDFSALPEAPEWLVARMRMRKEAKSGKNTNKKTLFDRHRGRPREVRYEIVAQCLDQIPTQGRGSNDFWWSIGAMIHSADLGEEGLELWRDWSKKDEEFAELWEPGAHDHCAERWEAGFSGEGLGIGTLIHLADKNDPERERFDSNLKRIVAEDEAADLSGSISFSDLYDYADEIFKDLDMSSSERRYRLMQLASRGNIRQKPVQEITEMYLGEREKRMGKEIQRSAVDRWENPASASYYVPGILCAGVWLVSGRGGTGKTNAAWAFAKHFLAGKPLDTKEGLRTWEKGNVLWLTGDQPDPVTDDQIRTHLDREDCKNLHVENNFNINDYPQFLALAAKHKPKFVVIDSLRSTHRGTGVSENDSEFALPLRWYEQMMGQPGMFEPCMIMVLHHSGKASGGARGTSALGDMTSFTADFEIPGDKSDFNKLTTRLITFQKHRMGLKGHQMAAMLQEDSTVKLHYLGVPSDQAASTVQDRVRLLLHRNPKKSYTIQELAANNLVSGKEDAVKKALQRLERLNVVQVAGHKEGVSGRPPKLWGAAGVVKAPNKSVSGIPESHQNPVVESDEDRDINRDKGYDVPKVNLSVEEAEKEWD